MNPLIRSSGILMHPTSLPGSFGIGSLGKEAYQFIDFLVKSGQKLWQIYPLGPTGYGDSPYQCFSAFAGNPLLINLENLKSQGFLTNDDISNADFFSEDRIDFGSVIPAKSSLLKKAFFRFKEKASPLEREKLESFCKKQAEWLNDFSLFMALKEDYKGRPWNEWEEGIRLRKSEALNQARKNLKNLIEFHQFVQYIFFDQWLSLKAYANRNKIQIIGDIPLYVAFDSADAWAHSDLFFFDRNRKPVKVAGVPPDYFSATGQLWGNPLYNWKKLRKTGYDWWIKRMKINLEMVDFIRLDHFRGFAGYWAVPFGNPTAENGTWEKGPGKELFKTLERKLGNLPIIAEDLGVITPDVIELRQSLNYPGMKILQFAFDDSVDNAHLPHFYEKNTVVYTGTHDNDTLKGWFETSNEQDKRRVEDYLNCNGKDIHWDFIRCAWASVAVFALAPLQDFLGLGKEARINTPGTPSGNWQWRLKKDSLNTGLANRIKKMTSIYQR